MEAVERVQARLTNIRSVEPILEALRTISIGSWQAALKQQARLREYESHLQAVLQALHPSLVSGTKRDGRPDLSPSPGPETGLDLAGPVRLAVLVIGSERGLCGRFNAVLVEAADGYIRAHSRDDDRVALWVLGSRLARLIRRRRWEPAWSGSLSATSLPPFSMAWELSHRWLADYEARRLDAVDVIYNAYRKPGVYGPTVLRLLPPELPTAAHKEVWPPPIVETDPLRIYARVVEQWMALSLYRALLESAASEHSARFQLMESATQNAERLILELTQLVQSARKHAITREMQELAVGAGLIGPRPSR